MRGLVWLGLGALAAFLAFRALKLGAWLLLRPGGWLVLAAAALVALRAA